MSRSGNNTPQVKTFLLVCEGSETEPIYFRLFNIRNRVTVYIHKHGTNSSAKNLPKFMDDALKNPKYTNAEEAWIVCDRDPLSNTEKQIKNIIKWTKTRDNRIKNFALSNINFEEWIKLHFTNNKLPNPYVKNLKGLEHNFTEQTANNAIDKAKKRYKSETNIQFYMDTIPSTSVWVLMEKILS